MLVMAQFRAATAAAHFSYGFLQWHHPVSITARVQATAEDITLNCILDCCICQSI